MRYALLKRRPDRRRNTCGFRIEDRKVVVVDLSLKNADQIKNVVMYGYRVFETDATVGIYHELDWALLDMQGEEVTPLSLGLIAKPRPELDYLNEIEGL